MQTKRKILFHKWISFLMIAGCGGLLTWAMMYQLSSGQPFDYPTFLDALGRYSFLVAALWIGYYNRIRRTEQQNADWFYCSYGASLLI